MLSLESRYLHVYSSHWVWLLGCSFALDRDSEYKLHCAVLLQIPRSLGEILTIYRRRNHNRIDSLSSRISKLAWNPNAESLCPFDRDSPQHNDQRPVGKVEKKRTGEQSKRVQKFCPNPPTECVRHRQVLSCLPPVSSCCLWKTSSFPDLSLYSGDRAKGKLPRGQSKTLVPRYFERRSTLYTSTMFSWQSFEHSQHTNHVVMTILRAFSTHQPCSHDNPSIILNTLCFHCNSHSSWQLTLFRFDHSTGTIRVFAKKKPVFLLILFMQFPSILPLYWRHNGKVYTFHRHSRWLYIQQQSSSSSSNRFIEHDVSTRKLGPSSGIHIHRMTRKDGSMNLDRGFHLSKIWLDLVQSACGEVLVANCICHLSAMSQSSSSRNCT